MTIKELIARLNIIAATHRDLNVMIYDAQTAAPRDLTGVSLYVIKDSDSADSGDCEYRAGEQVCTLIGG